MPENQITARQQMIRLIGDNIRGIGSTENWTQAEIASLFLYVASAADDYDFDFYESHFELIDIARTWGK